MTAVTRRAPGKLFITGEYAVMQPGTPAILVAVDRLISVTASPTEPTEPTDADGVVVTTELHPQPVRLQWHQLCLAGRTPADDLAARDLSHVVAAIEVLAELLHQRGLPTPACTLAISSELHENGTKIGLGSSGAVTVAVIAAAAEYCGVQLTRDAHFRLAMIASARLDANSSGADLAASIWRGWIVYRAPDRAAVLDIVQRSGIEAALQADWPGLAVRRLPVPPELTLEVGWTGQPASTRELVAGPGTSSWRGSRLHRQFVTAMAGSVQATVEALDQGDLHAVLAEIRSARRLLAGLDEAVGLGIFTDKLIALCEAADAVGGAGKPSGAGGGDCGIALLDTAEVPDVARLRTQWATAGVQHLPLAVISNETDDQ